MVERFDSPDTAVGVADWGKLGDDDAEIDGLTPVVSEEGLFDTTTVGYDDCAVGRKFVWFVDPKTSCSSGVLLGEIDGLGGGFTEGDDVDTNIDGLVESFSLGDTDSPDDGIVEGLGDRKIVGDVEAITVGLVDVVDEGNEEGGELGDGVGGSWRDARPDTRKFIKSEDGEIP